MWTIIWQLCSSMESVWHGAKLQKKKEPEMMIAHRRSLGSWTYRPCTYPPAVALAVPSRLEYPPPGLCLDAPCRYSRLSLNAMPPHHRSSFPPSHSFLYHAVSFFIHGSYRCLKLPLKIYPRTCSLSIALCLEVNSYERRDFVYLVRDLLSVHGVFHGTEHVLN